MVISHNTKCKIPQPILLPNIQIDSVQYKVEMLHIEALVRNLSDFSNETRVDGFTTETKTN